MKAILRDTWRLLTFRLTREEFEAFDLRHLALGLLSCWLAGMGRFWATPNLPAWAHLGMGSVLYPFVLALMVLLVTSPFSKGRASYLHLVTFIALTGPIAFLYAPLTADLMGVEGASVTRAIAMGIVSLWRVALLIYYCTRLAGLGWIQASVACALLLTGVVATLTALNLERAVFNIMGGNDVAHTIADDSYAFLVRLTLLSIMALPVSFICYLVVCFMSKPAGSNGV